MPTTYSREEAFGEARKTDLGLKRTFFYRPCDIERFKKFPISQIAYRFKKNYDGTEELISTPFMVDRDNPEKTHDVGSSGRPLSDLFGICKATDWVFAQYREEIDFSKPVHVRLPYSFTGQEPVETPAEPTLA